MAETTRVFSYALELLERGIHAVVGVLDAGLQSGASPRLAALRRRCICAAPCELRTTNLKNDNLCPGE